MCNIIQSLKFIQDSIGDIQTYSDVYSNESWGFSSDEVFLNMVVEILTPSNEREVLESLLRIQSETYSRHNNTLYNSRDIDIDILFFNDLILSCDNLCVPHPLLHLRDFCIQPLFEIAPKIIHPVFLQTTEQLYTSSGFNALKCFVTKSDLQKMLSQS